MTASSHVTKQHSLTKKANQNTAPVVPARELSARAKKQINYDEMAASWWQKDPSASTEASVSPATITAMTLSFPKPQQLWLIISPNSSARAKFSNQLRTPAQQVRHMEACLTDLLHSWYGSRARRRSAHNMHSISSGRKKVVSILRTRRSASLIRHSSNIRAT